MKVGAGVGVGAALQDSRDGVRENAGQEAVDTLPASVSPGTVQHLEQGFSPKGDSPCSLGDMGHCLETFLVLRLWWGGREAGRSRHPVGRGQGCFLGSHRA